MSKYVSSFMYVNWDCFAKIESRTTNDKSTLGGELAWSPYRICKNDIKL